jgi:hypothetical protein
LELSLRRHENTRSNLMREAGSWKKSLIEDLSALKDAYGPISMAAPAILDTELVLTVMKDYFPGQDPYLAWTVFNGYSFPALETLSDDARKAIVLTRLHLPWLVGRGAWLDHLEQYQHIPPPYPLYCLDGYSIIDQANAVLPERREVIRAALCTPPPWKEHPPHYAASGHYHFYIKRERHEVEIPARAASIASRQSNMLDWSPVARREPILVSLSNLQQEARWMDQHASPSSWADQSWEKRLQAVRLRLVDETGLRESDVLPLDGLLHLIGMVGSGKSSLFTVLAVHLARNGYRVAIVQSDVASLLREHATFTVLSHADPESLRSVPLVGRSTRVAHLNRLHTTETLRTGTSLSREHPAFPFLSTICPLDGLRRDVQPIEPGEEPCTRLYLLDDEEETANRRKDCPFMPSCPVHLPTSSLAEARIWLVTPASLLASGPQQPLVPENIRNVEMIMRHVDVVLVDEADLVQVQFDDRFAPMEVLVRGRGESWLDRLAVQVSRQVYRSGRPLVGKQAGLDRWLIAHDNTQRAVNRLYILLRESAATRNWLGSTYFSRDRLIQRLANELEPLLASVEEFKKLAWKFAESPLAGYTEVEELRTWYAAVHFEMLESATSVALRQLESWLEKAMPTLAVVERRQIEQLAHHLLIMLLVIVLDYAMQDMIVQWPAAEALDLDRGTGGLFYHPSSDLVRMVPEPPMGAVLGFQYYDGQSNGDGELRFFHIRGLGRSLLYHLHDILQCSDNVAGPHVVLTSGTSWAPSSWRYHIHVKPEAVLLPQKISASGTEEEEQGDVIRCFYEPFPDPARPGKYLTVSGLPEVEQRLRSLKAMIQALARPQAFAPSVLDTELTSLPVDRQRILLVVGSYTEAYAVGETLTDILTSRQEVPYEEVLTLIPDSEGEGEDEWRAPAGKLPRSMLNYMPKRPARFLIAPLQSIERGHNILVGQQAAIGSVYFLVRPYPVPGDIHAAIHKLNTWAIRYVPTLVAPQATIAGAQLRQQAAWRWDRALEEKVRYKGLDDNERTALLWTQFVLVWQCIGRLLRGGVSARVHFIDARWAEMSAEGQRDTEKTSMLVGFRRILQEALAAPNPAHRAIAEVLYKDAAAAFNHVEGVHYA